MSISSATAISKFNKTDFKRLSIPIPPFKEQLRIVAKIEELFAILDEIQKSIEACPLWISLITMLPLYPLSAVVR